MFGSIIGPAVGALLTELSKEPFVSSAISPSSLMRAEPEAEQSDDECQGCGAPLQALAHKCEYCDRTTKHGARQARLAKLSMSALPTHPAQLPNYQQDNPFNNVYASQWSKPWPRKKQ